MAPHIIQEIAKAITDWEEQLEWIAKGWDCLEEYQHDLGCREELDILLEQNGKPEALPETLVQRITASDERFRSITAEAGVSVWHTGAQFRYVDGHVELNFKEYDPKKYWYYYRWLPGHPYSFQDHDNLSYQKAMYGLDFRNMSQQELIIAALAEMVRYQQYVLALQR